MEQFRVAGLDGNDVIEFIGGPQALDLSSLINRSDDFVTRIDGGPGDDLLVGTVARDRIDGGFGSDTIYGFAGDDRLWGDQGVGYGSRLDHDILFAGQGNDDLIGGQGENELYAWSFQPDADVDVPFDPRTPGVGNGLSQFGVFVDSDGTLRDDAQQNFDIGDISAVDRISGSSIGAAAQLDRFQFELNSTGTADDVITLQDLNDSRSLKFELYSSGQLIGEAATSDSKFATISLESLPSGDYEMRVSLVEGADPAEGIPYDLQAVVDGGGTAQIDLAIELEDTGLNRLLGAAQDDQLYAGTGLDFLYGGDGRKYPVHQEWRDIR